MSQIECSSRADLFAQSQTDCALKPKGCRADEAALGTLAHDLLNPFFLQNRFVLIS